MRGMDVPVWLTLMCAVFVIIWGGYRVKLGLRSGAAEARAAEKKGLFGMPRRTHLLVGIIYLLLGAGLLAISFGWNPVHFDAGEPEPALPAPGGAVPVETR